MCGLAGYLLLQPQGVGFDPARRLHAMIGTLRHRGPDDLGVWWDGVCGLALARLAVIDLSLGGHQPMQTEDGRLCVAQALGQVRAAVGA